jgi:hypothetical protein
MSIPKKQKTSHTVNVLMIGTGLFTDQIIICLFFISFYFF